MLTRPRIEVGAKFGDLEIIGGEIRKPISPGRTRPHYPARCQCGTVKDYLVYNLLKGMSKSCGGCKKSCSNLRHGETRTKLHQHWVWMRTRCNNPRIVEANAYSARGIAHCSEWNTYENFRDWALSHGYAEGLTLERFDVNAGYCPENCGWIERREQARNRQNTVYVTAFGETKKLIEWSEDPRCKATYFGLHKRISKGWPPELALTLPPIPRGQKAGCSTVERSAFACIGDGMDVPVTSNI
jgi:hypothetical protein